MKSLLKCVYVQYNRIMYENEECMYVLMMIAMNDVYIHVNRMNNEQYIIDQIVLIHNDGLPYTQPWDDRYNEEIKEAINTLFKNQNLQNEIIENQKKYINNYSARDLVELIKENF